MKENEEIVCCRDVLSRYYKIVFDKVYGHIV